MTDSSPTQPPLATRALVPQVPSARNAAKGQGDGASDAAMGPPSPPVPLGGLPEGTLAADSIARLGRIGYYRAMLAKMPARRLMALARPQWRRIALGTLFLAIGSAAALAFPQAVRVILDSALVARAPAQVDEAAMLLLGAFALQAVAIALRAWLFTAAGERIVSDLRLKLYRHVLDLEIGFFDQSRTGELLSRLAVDTGVLQNAVSVNISMTLRSLAMTVGGIALLAWTSPKLTLVMLATVPAAALGTVLYGRKIRHFASQVQDAYARATSVAEEAISGIRTVRSHAGEHREYGRYQDAIEHAYGLALRRTTWSSMFMALASFAGYGAVALVVWSGGHMVIEGQLTVGDLTSFVLYTLTVAFSLGTLGSLWADLMRAVGAADRVFMLLDRPSGMVNEGGERLERVSGRVELQDVHFAYPARPDAEVLRGLSLRAEPGEVVALVGPSGAGKSTIRALLSRFYDPDRGVVRIDDVDLRRLDPTWLRSVVAGVAQEPQLFSATIAENIRYGRPEATDAEVRAAASAANAEGFILDFAEGYATEVGERGVRLSGGQKQRVAIARALLADPRILVLDEATSALDAESEHLVKEALERLMVGRTTLIIAHRLSTVRDADRVCVIDAGTVAEEGTHDSLLQRDGLYRRLVERQFATEASIGVAPTPDA